MDRLSYSMSPPPEQVCDLGSCQPCVGVNFVEKEDTGPTTWLLSDTKHMLCPVITESSVERFNRCEEYIRWRVLLLPTTQQQFV